MKEKKTVSPARVPPDLHKRFSRHRLTAAKITEFQDSILEHYTRQGRRLPWRTTRDPYRILVSEIMLQQTQVDRVVDKYLLFIKAFPDTGALAAASLSQVLKRWQGLGYNRRAIALKKCADVLVKTTGGRVPENNEALVKLPGIGPYTASAVCVFAYNQPQVFVETNIRTVFIHFFFRQASKVQDRTLLPLVEKTLYRRDPRRWYNALMDYGVCIKKLLPNPSRKSAHYNTQSPFQGSDRQIRGRIIKELTEKQSRTSKALIGTIGKEPLRTERILEQLIKEGFIIKKGQTCRLA